MGGPGSGRKADGDFVTILDFFVDEFVEPGGIILAGYPDKMPCKCVSFEGKDFCTRRGVIGTLTQDQNTQLCSTMEAESDHRLERYKIFRACADKIHPQLANLPQGRERLLYWLEHMGECLKAGGGHLR